MLIIIIIKNASKNYVILRKSLVLNQSHPNFIGNKLIIK